ncbi:MAG: Molybdate/tungstate-binding protein WtpA precursor [Methanoregula sp. PtaU1.Bin051]|nr:MAG: Molybdate/tungstate-binding protein WtpA precursor [Methanoregula sp. PtaU1.Bin051]
MRGSLKHFMILLCMLLIGGVFIAGCTTAPTTPAATPAAAAPSTLTIATTTSLYDTGLLNYLEPIFEKQYNVDLKITSQGTGKAIEIAKKGDADILLVHSPTQEATFLEEGYGLNRRTFAYNYFKIVGPASDPAGIRGKTPEEAFKAILTQGKAGNGAIMFVSRGDASGTHTSEQGIWKKAGYDYAKDVQKSGNWYIEAGKGMGETLQMASEKGAYTYTDEGTFLAYQGKLSLVPIVEEGASLMNIYSVMTVYPANPQVDKIAMSNNFVNWLISPDTMNNIGNFGKDKYGKGLFTPMTTGIPKGVTADFTTPATATKPLKVYHAGSLQSSLSKLEKTFEKAHPDIDVQLFSGGSGAIVDKVTKQNQKADVLASADYSLIPKYMVPNNATFYIDFAKNSIVLCYTDASKYSGEVTADNWYKILGRADVRFAISDPKTDPAGYRSLMTIGLAEKKYNDATIFNSLLASNSRITKTVKDGVWTIDVTNTSPDAKKLTITATGPDIAPLLKDGKTDYAFEYSSVAAQSGLKFIALPTDIDLSDPEKTAQYQTMQVKRPSGSTTVTETGTPIVYAVTVPVSARFPDLGYEFVKLLVGSDGQAVLNADGQTPIVPAEAFGSVPGALKPAVTVKG